jgi:hypothetical protein
MQSFDLITALLDTWHDDHNMFEDTKMTASHRPFHFFGKFESSNELGSQIHCTDTHSQWMPCSQYIFVCWLWYDYYEVLWFALIYSERCTRTYTIKTWSTFWRIIYLLMSSECIQIWLGTHSAKQEKNAPSRCRSSFPNG